MGATERLLVRLRDTTPSDVPSDLQLPLAEQLRDLAHDLELQARFTAAPKSSPIENQSPRNLETIEPPATSIEFSPPCTLYGSSSMTKGDYSSTNWETMDTSDLLLPSNPSNELTVSSTLPIGSNGFMSIPNPSEDEWQSESSSTFSFDNSPLSLDLLSTFENSPGPDRQMPLFAAKYGQFMYRKSPISLPSMPALYIVGDGDDDVSVLTPQSKKVYRYASAHSMREDSMPGKATSPYSIPSEDKISAEVSSGDRSGSVEDEDAQSIPSDRSDSIEDRNTTESLTFLTGCGKSSPDDPFWIQSPKNYPSLEDPNDSASSHNRFSAPVNRSHKLLLALKAVKQDATHASPFSERGLEIAPAIQDADQPPRQEIVPAVIRKKVKSSMWKKS